MFRETKQHRNIRNVIWDWNGTLLDDVDVCISCINLLLDKRNLKKLDILRYREIFTFPVKEYYQQAGFDFNTESFDILAVEFIDHYKNHIRKAGLFQDVMPALEKFREAGVRQFMISAMEHEFLTELLKLHKLTGYFDAFSGIEDHHANSKTTIARRLVNNFGLDNSNTVFIGDTLHDYEVAEQTGVQCLLINRGHQSHQRLLNSGTKVTGNLSDACLVLLNHQKIYDHSENKRERL